MQRLPGRWSTVRRAIGPQWSPMVGVRRRASAAASNTQTPVTSSSRPDEWHWHGAAPDHFMTHLSITEAVPGDQRPETDWGEHVTDDEYHNR
jgi:hypothetical protein